MVGETVLGECVGQTVTTPTALAMTATVRRGASCRERRFRWRNIDRAPPRVVAFAFPDEFQRNPTQFCPPKKFERDSWQVDFPPKFPIARDICRDFRYMHLKVTITKSSDSDKSQQPYEWRSRGGTGGTIVFRVQILCASPDVLSSAFYGNFDFNFANNMERVTEN